MVAQTETSWSGLMAAPWGQFTPAAVKAKAEALASYQASWIAWRDRRVADGKWVGTPATYDEA